MTLTDDELKLELARLLPEHIDVARPPGTLSLVWHDIGVVRETEMLYLCYLLRVKYSLNIGVGWSEPWQEQVRLASVCVRRA